MLILPNRASMMSIATAADALVKEQTSVFTRQGSGRGKRGGVRVIYYWAASHDVVLMLLIYGKNERDDLSAEQRKVLVALVKEEFK